jgi:hypothetical protein
MMTGREGSRGQEVYQIKVRGRLHEKWSSWFHDMTITVEKARDGSSVTTLTGAIADQARLRGIVSRLWDLNMKVISVSEIESEEPRSPPLRDSELGGKIPEN